MLERVKTFGYKRIIKDNTVLLYYLWVLASLYIQIRIPFYTVRIRIHSPAFKSNPLLALISVCLFEWAWEAVTKFRVRFREEIKNITLTFAACVSMFRCYKIRKGKIE